jgi:hypothetical protein
MPKVVSPGAELAEHVDGSKPGRGIAAEVPNGYGTAKTLGRRRPNLQLKARSVYCVRQHLLPSAGKNLPCWFLPRQQVSFFALDFPNSAH